MKRILPILGAILLTLSMYGQSPEKFSYQAIVRDGSDNLVTSSTTPIQISILQTTITGTAVYVEKHDTASTNVNGLLSIEIGSGTVVSGAMSTIDWGVDVYFVKTEVDVDNNASYDITGASQLLSVPYALHAKTAENVTETQTLANVVALGSAANSQLKNVTDPTDGQDAATKSYVDALIAELDTRIAAFEPTQVGDFKYGGIVFYIFQSGDLGYVANETHGLVCAVSDLPTGAKWGVWGRNVPGAVATAIGYGAANTAGMITTNGPAGYAGSSRVLYFGGFTDWYLPSKDELNQMYLNKAAINTTAIANGGAALLDSDYLSSTQYSLYSAWEQDLSSGRQSGLAKDATSGKARSIRTF